MSRILSLWMSSVLSSPRSTVLRTSYLKLGLYTTILAREVDFSKMKKDSLKISKLRTSGGGGQGFGTPVGRGV